MKKNLSRFLSLSIVFVLSLCLTGAYPPQVKDAAKIVGDWKMEVDAGGEYYYLSFSVREEAGKLSGTISEESGSFADVKMEKLEFDGQKFLFEMTVPTPPDGLENLVKGNFELKEGKLEGMLTIEELGIIGYSTCTKK
jgi:hypothetical protein